MRVAPGAHVTEEVPAGFSAIKLVPPERQEH